MPDDALPEFPSDYPAIISIDTLNAYIIEIDVWAVNVKDVVRKNHARRVNTAQCLDSLRTRSLIN